jgi:hypothetical protein
VETQQLAPASIASGKFEHYFHACGFFRSADEEHRILGPFLAEGLSWGEKAVYIVDPAVADTHLERLARFGVDCSTNPEQLDLLTWTQTYLRNGRFDKDQMMDAVVATIQAGKQQGYPRTRIVGQMGWALEGHPGSDRLLEYEVEVNEVLAKARHPAVCVYDVDRLSGSLMMELLRVHPMTIVGGVLYENPFYVPAEQMLEELRGRKKASA